MLFALASERVKYLCTQQPGYPRCLIVHKESLFEGKSKKQKLDFLSSAFGQHNGAFGGLRNGRSVTYPKREVKPTSKLNAVLWQHNSE